MGLIGFDTTYEQQFTLRFSQRKLIYRGRDKNSLLLGHRYAFAFSTKSEIKHAEAEYISESEVMNRSNIDLRPQEFSAVFTRPCGHSTKDLASHTYGICRWKKWSIECSRVLHVKHYRDRPNGNVIRDHFFFLPFEFFCCNFLHAIR